MIDTSESTRSGCRAAIVWAIMPPIDAPTMWAGSMPSSSSSPSPSSAMSASRYGGLLIRRVMISRALGVGPVAQVRRAADVAVVVADHVEAAVGELVAEIGVPADHLGAETHDEQHGGTVRIAERLVAELDVPDRAEALVHLPAARYRGSRFGISTTCWKVGRFCHGISGCVMPPSGRCQIASKQACSPSRPSSAQTLSA